MVCLLSLVWMSGCSHEPEIIPPVVTISTDHTSIKANNKDQAIFKVTVDGIETTSSVVITEKNRNTPVEGMSFSTDSAAVYTFFATYQNVKSNEISIDAVEIEVILTVDKHTIKANNKDMVTFTVKADDEIVTSSATIMQMESAEWVVPEAGFSTGIPGTYTFSAIYNEKRSNEIQIDASAVVVTLSVDKPSIKANNWDKSVFTVKADSENVTSSAVIMQKNNGMALEKNEFLTDVSDTYTFYAIYEGGQSNEAEVEATYVTLAFLQGYSIAEITSTSCPNCVLMTEELRQLQQTLPGQIHLIALHPYGKYCYSDLAGALGELAVQFVDNVNTNAPPLAIVDLYDPVRLHVSDTRRYFADALRRTTFARDRASLTGMAVKSATNGSNIDFEVSVKTIKTDSYHFFAFIVEDSIINKQMLGEYQSDPYHVFNNVATYHLTEGDPYQGVNLGIVTAGNETTRSFSIDTNNFKTGRNVNLANCRIVCYTLRSKDGSHFFVDNVTNCPVNGSVRYLYER